MKKDDKQLILYAGGIALAYFGVLRPILNKLGITNSATNRIVTNQSNLPNNVNPFSPIFYKKAPVGSLLLKTSIAQSLAKRLHDAMGFFVDDEATVFAVFRSLKTQTQVSILSEVFTNMYKTDMLEYLKKGSNNYNPASGLNEDELNTVISIVNGLPKYK
jgi:hypothetical protein